ncbi:MAG: TonB-dependent receptor [Rhodanobacter sp.]
MSVNFTKRTRMHDASLNGLSTSAMAMALFMALFAGNTLAQEVPAADAATPKAPAQSGINAQEAPAADAAAPKVPAHGDKKAPVASTLEEIVVTSTFRTKNVQKVPIAITAINADMMESRGMTSVLDVAASAPNVTLAPASASYGSGVAASIRGIGQYDSSFALEPGVGMYVDDVYQPTLMGSMFDLLDLDRVEILRGPQGTLAGKNSIGGAVKLYSKKPSENVDGFLYTAIGSDNRRDIRGGASFTVVPEKLFVRVSAVAKKQDGYMTRYSYACEHPGTGKPTISPDCKIGADGGENATGLRAAARWLPTNKLEVNFIADTSEDNTTPTPAKLLAGNPRYVNDARYVSYATYNSPSKGYSVPAKSVMSSKGASAHVDYSFTDDVKLTSISAYRNYSNDYGVDSSGGPDGTYLQHWDNGYHFFSQELRLNGNLFAGALDYTIGAYYFDGNGLSDSVVDIPRLYTLQHDLTAAKSKSGFLHTVYHATDRIDLSAGVRYTDESKRYQFGRTNPITFLPTNTIDGQVSTYSGSKVDTRLSADYKFSDATMLYATYSTGFRGGGVNPKPFVPSQLTSFLPETLDAYELGFKSDLIPRVLRLNGAAFINKYNDILVTITNGYGGFPVSALPLNAGKAEVKGAELELTAFPIKGLAIDSSFSYLNFKYTSLSAAALASKITYDDVTPYTPKLKASVGIQYEIRLGAGLLVPRLDANYNASFFTNGSNTQLGRVNSSTVFNTSLNWRPSNSNWEGTVAVRNLTNKYYYLNKQDLLSASGIATGTPARAREWMLSLRYNIY